MARYRKIDVRMWLDSKFRSLSAPQPNARDCWIYLLTNPETSNIPGLYRAYEETLARGLGWSLESFRERFAELSSRGMVKADWDAGLVFIPNAIRYDAPANPNTIKSWLDTWDELPECALKVEAYRHFDGYLKRFTGWYAQAFPIGFWNGSTEGLGDGWSNGSGNGMANPDPEPEPEPEQEPEEQPPPAEPSVGAGAQVELAVEEPEREPEPERKKAAPADVQTVIGEYCRVWVETRQPEDGKPPALAKEDRFQAAKLVRDHGVDQALEFVRRYLADPDRWLVEQGHPLRLIARRINGYRARAGPSKPRGFSEPCGPFAETREETL